MPERNDFFMKITDDYKAKLKLWAEERRVCPMPKAVGLPPFKGQKFSSPEEMNRWEKEYLAEIAKQGGVQWKN